MGAGSTCAAIAALCCFMFLPLVFQTVGMFTPMWASNSTCDSIGIVYSCCTGDNNDTCGITNAGNELDARVLGLEATSFVVMFLAVFCSCVGACCSSNDDDDDNMGWCQIVGGCCFMLYPVAGLFSVIGCIIVATKFSTSALGYSFYLCLVSGCFVILVTIILCYCICKHGMDDDAPSRQPAGSLQEYGGGGMAGSVQQYSGGGMAPYDPPRQAQVQIHQVHQTVAIHDEESGGVFVLMRRMNIISLVGSMRH